MDIYWIQDHERKGPLPEVEVISMLEAGLIPENAGRGMPDARSGYASVTFRH